MIRRFPDNVNDEEKAAVLAAMEEIRRLPDGENKLQVVRLVLLKKSHTLQGAALQIPCSYETAKRWQQQFIRAVGRNFRCNGLKD